jgi:nucleoside-diphosphate-sugar epimerase
MRSYLVTGGAGFIGSAIVKNLLKNGNSVTVLDDFSRGSISRLEENQNEIKFVDLDIRDSEKVLKVFKDHDFNAVIHLAYINGTSSFYSKPEEVLDVALSGIKNVIEGIRLSRIDEFYLASSSEVYQNPEIFPTPEDIKLVVPDPNNPRFSYGLGKIVQEFMTLNFLRNLDKVIIFRPHNIYGPDMGFGHVVPELFLKIAESKSNFIELKGSGKQKRSFCFIDDFISAFEILLQQNVKSGIYNIGSNFECEIIELAKIISDLYNRKLEFVSTIPPLGETSRRVPDLTKLKNLGYKAEFSIDKGLKIYKNWFEDKGKKNVK